MSDLRKHEKGCRVAKDKQEEKEGENEVKPWKLFPARSETRISLHALYY
jgi:hypothetical protein